MLQRVFAVDAPDMLVAARSVVGSSRRGTSATSAADMASSAITTTVTDSAASSPWAYRSASHPIPSIRRTSTAPIRTAIPPRPGTTPRTVTGVTATSRAAPERRLRGRGSSSPQANLRGARHAVDARMNDGDAGLKLDARVGSAVPEETERARGATDAGLYQARDDPAVNASRLGGGRPRRWSSSCMCCRDSLCTPRRAHRV